MKRIPVAEILVMLAIIFTLLGGCNSNSSGSKWYTDSNGYKYNQDGYYDDNGNGHYDEDDLYGNGKSWNYLD